MALISSTMLSRATRAPDFSLPDTVSGKTISLQTFAGKKALLVMFICRHCPYVKHIQTGLAKLGKDYVGKDVGIVAISSNDALNYPDDAPASLAVQTREQEFTFPYCYDESQAVARAYRTVCTPDLFLFDGARALVYRGQFDDSRPGNGRPVTGHDLRAALEAVLTGTPVPVDQIPSIGCNIKWK